MHNSAYPDCMLYLVNDLLWPDQTQRKARKQIGICNWTTNSPVVA